MQSHVRTDPEGRCRCCALVATHQELLDELEELLAAAWSPQLALARVGPKLAALGLAVPSISSAQRHRDRHMRRSRPIARRDQRLGEDVIQP